MRDMNLSKSQYRRIMELDRRIRDGLYPNCLTFAAEWEVSQKTIQRDIDYLRDQCGAPIRYDREEKGYYYDAATWVLPSIMLSEGELLAVLVGSRAVAQYKGTPIEARLRRVFDKLTELLPEGLSIHPAELFTDFSFQAPPARPVDPDVWLAVTQGLINRTTVEIVYRLFGAGETKPGKVSRINPYHIANRQGEWYVFAVHAGHEDVRQFSMGRIVRAALTDSTYHIPRDFDAAKLFDSAFGRFAGGGEEHTVKLLFDHGVADWVTEREWHPAQQIKRRKNGDVELTFPAKGLYEVQRWVLSWGRQVRVLAPPALCGAVEKEIGAMAEALNQKKGE
jgi:predicted DNA-binding transcriptional regulator YafY